MVITESQRTNLEAEIFRTLLKNAVDCTFYVAAGKAFTRELAEKYDIDKDAVQGIVSLLACKIVDSIRNITNN